MLPTHLDHLVITAPTLQAGARWVEDALGVPLQAGGKHPRMGTHNLLLRLGHNVYLEVIAIDPDAPVPDRPRWFGLDAHAGTRLATWVLRSSDIDATAQAMHAVADGVELGAIETMTRGDLEWRITIPSDGQPAMQGIAPSLIQWGKGPHPASRLQEAGCSLLGLHAYHQDAGRARSMLASAGFEGAVEFIEIGPNDPPRLQARIQTPSGIRVLGQG